MKPKEFTSLIALLEDPDQEVFNAISSKLVNEGLLLIPLLEKAWETSGNELLQSRIEELLHRIQFENTKKNLTSWVRSGGNDLLQGAVCVAKYHYPDIEYEVIENIIEKIKRKIWHELNESLTPLEKVKVINHIIYQVCGYRGNTTNFFSPQNHFINQLLETKRGGPVLMAVFYIIIAQRLGLPIYGVSLPRNFLLAYKDKYRISSDEDEKSVPVHFYINPFNNGVVLGKKEIEQFLEQHKIEKKQDYFIPCTNRTAVSQLIASLMISFQKTSNPEKINDLKVFLDILSEKVT
ncbi:MAG: transglutaminase-like domain-containing protein [Bacteroidales bacterium]